MRYAITPPERVHLAVRGSDEIYPVRRVYCVGRNYAAHAIEMGHDPDREDPFFFLKCPENIVTGGGDFPYPPASSDVHHEIETVVALGSGGRDIAVEDLPAIRAMTASTSLGAMLMPPLTMRSFLRSTMKMCSSASTTATSPVRSQSPSKASASATGSSR